MITGLIFYLIALIALFISALIDRQKTSQALKIAWKKMISVLPHFLLMIILISISLYFVPDTVIAELLGRENLYLSSFLASLIGSVAVMPGFIVFPLGGILVQKGVSYMVIAAFTTTLMLVGFLSYPMERKFLGDQKALIRNMISYLVAIAVAIMIGMVHGEIRCLS